MENKIEITQSQQIVSKISGIGEWLAKATTTVSQAKAAKSNLTELTRETRSAHAEFIETYKASYKTISTERLNTTRELDKFKKVVSEPENELKRLIEKVKEPLDTLANEILNEEREKAKELAKEQAKQDEQARQYEIADIAIKNKLAEKVTAGAAWFQNLAQSATKENLDATIIKMKQGKIGENTIREWSRSAFSFYIFEPSEAWLGQKYIECNSHIDKKRDEFIELARTYANDAYEAQKKAEELKKKRELESEQANAQAQAYKAVQSINIQSDSNVKVAGTRVRKVAKITNPKELILHCMEHHIYGENGYAKWVEQALTEAITGKYGTSVPGVMWEEKVTSK